MDDDLQDLYQQVIVDHSRRPRNYGPLPGSDHTAVGHNPLCGDHYAVHLRTQGDVIAEARFEGSGCAISKAAASVMTTAVQGRTRDEAVKLFDQFHQLVTTGEANLDPANKLTAFAGVHRFPARVKCALLSWHALKAALENGTMPVSTEDERTP